MNATQRVSANEQRTYLPVQERESIATDFTSTNNHRLSALRRIILLFRSFPPLLALRMALFFLAKRLLNGNASINYSQTGEDAIVRALLDETILGIYVDVGCNHPLRWSNTLSLYLHGWRGINIDANPDLVALFRKTRTRDTAICAAVSDVERDVIFHEFEDNLVSTMDSDSLPEWEVKWKRTRDRVVRTRTLNSVLEEQLATNENVDVLSVDVEGHDLNVLRSIDLDRYRPKLIVVEMHGFEIANAAQSEITSYLETQGFKQVAFDSLNGYFIDKRSLRAGMRLAPHAAGSFAALAD